MPRLWDKLRQRSKAKSPTPPNDKASAAPIQASQTQTQTPPPPPTAPITDKVAVLVSTATVCSDSSTLIDLKQDLVACDNDANNGFQDIWSSAYGQLRKREPELTAHYEAYLCGHQGPVESSESFLLSDPRAIESFVQHLLKDRQSKQWHFDVLGKDIVVREQAEKLAKFLLWTDGIVSRAVNSDPYCALAWSAVSLAFPLLATGSAQHQSMLKGFNDISSLQMYWKTCQETFLVEQQQHNYQGLISPLSNLYSIILEYQARAICHLSKDQTSRALEKMTGATDWDAIIRRAQLLSDECDKYIGITRQNELREQHQTQMTMMEKTYKVEEKLLQAFEESRQDDNERSLFRELAAAATSYETDKDFNLRKVDGTCEWFFDDSQFCRWRDTESSSLLWVSAAPGCGKSVLSRALIDDQRITKNVTKYDIKSSSIVVNHPDPTVCYFFFKEGVENRVTITSALSALLHQLFSSGNTQHLIKYGLESHKRLGTMLPQNSSALWKLLMECIKDPEAGEIVCVLDALDECRKEDRKELISKLKDFYLREDIKVSSKLKFFITSRPYSDLEAAFRQFAAHTAYLHFDGDEKSDDISNDIKLVIASRVSQMSDSLGPEDRQRITDRLQEMGTRTYLWLHLTLGIIEDSPHEYSRTSDIEDLLSSLPSEVSEAYEKILNRTKRPDITEVLLRIALASQRPMTLTEINYALTLASTDQQFASVDELKTKVWRGDVKSIIRNYCGLILNVYEDQVFFIHLTAREFLLDSDTGSKTGWQGRLNNMTESHSQLSSSCVKYLSIPGHPTPALNFYQSDDTQKQPLLWYAANHWAFHYRSGDESSTALMQNNARELCRAKSPTTIAWVRIFLHTWADPGYPLHDWETWTDLMVASFFGLCSVITAILQEPGVDINNHIEGSSFGTAIAAAAAHGHKKAVELLVSKNAKVNSGGIVHTSAFVGAAFIGDIDTLSFLYEQHGHEIQDMESVLIAAMKSEKMDSAIYLLERNTNNEGITPEVLYWAVHNYHHKFRLMAMLLKKGVEEHITEDEVIPSIFIHWDHEDEVLAAAIKKTMENGHIPDRTAGFILANRNTGAKIMRLILAEPKFNFKASEDTLRKAIWNLDLDQDMLFQLLDRREDDIIPQDILARIIRRGATGYKRMMIIRDRYANKYTLTQEVIIAAVQNSTHSMDLLDYFIDTLGVEIITENILCIAAQHETCADKILSFLFDRLSDKLLITEALLLAAIDNRESGFNLTALLVRRQIGTIIITERLLKAVIKNWPQGCQILEMFINESKVSISISQEMAKTIGASGRKDMLDLLSQHQEFVQIQDELYLLASLDRAVCYGHIDTLNQLLNEGVDPDVPDAWGDTPLINAFLERREEMIKILACTEGVNINAVTPERGSSSCLFLAVTSFSEEIVRILVERGADPYHINDEGNWAMQDAEDGKHKPLVAIMSKVPRPTNMPKPRGGSIGYGRKWNRAEFED